MDFFGVLLNDYEYEIKFALFIWLVWMSAKISLPLFSSRNVIQVLRKKQMKMNEKKKKKIMRTEITNHSLELMSKSNLFEAFIYIRFIRLPKVSKQPDWKNQTEPTTGIEERDEKEIALNKILSEKSKWKRTISSPFDVKHMLSFRLSCISTSKLTLFIFHEWRREKNADFVSRKFSFSW